MWRKSILCCCQMGFQSDKPLEVTHTVATRQLSMLGEKKQHLHEEGQVPLKGTASIPLTRFFAEWSALVPGSFLPVAMHFCPFVCTSSNAHSTDNCSSSLSSKITIQLLFWRGLLQVQQARLAYLVDYRRGERRGRVVALVQVSCRHYGSSVTTWSCCEFKMNDDIQDLPPSCWGGC